MKRSRLLISVVLGLASAHLAAREWTSNDGRKLEADFVSATADAVTVKRATDGQTFTLPLASISEADRAWVAEQMTKPAGPAKPVEGPYAELVTGDWALSEHNGLPFALYAAKDLDASKKIPLVLALHGKSDNNENGKQVGGWMKTFASPANFEQRPCIIVAPLCYQPYGATGGGWSDEPGDKAIALVEALMENLPIDENRVYVIGYSMGGFGTFHLIAEEPKLFAAGVPVAGFGMASQAGSFKRKPIWLFHAADDATVSVDGSRSLAEEMKRSEEFKYTEFPTGGHGIIGQVFNDTAVHEWLFSQKSE